MDQLTDLEVADPLRLHLHGDEGGVVVPAREGEVFDVDALVLREVVDAKGIKCFLILLGKLFVIVKTKPFSYTYR